MESNPNILSPFDVDRIRNETPANEVLLFEHVDSTNDQAIRWVSNPSNRCPLIVLANNQLSGRGQRGSNWRSGKGSLTFSLGLAAKDIGSTPTLIPLAVGVSVCQAVCRVGSIENVLIKWPNDIIFDRKKVGGILIETVGSDRVVIGVGFYANNSTTQIEVNTIGLFGAIAINEICGKDISLTELVIECANLICENLAFANADENTQRAFQEYSFLSNCILEIETPVGEILRGVCKGISSSGSLLLSDEKEADKKPIQVASGQICKIEYPESDPPRTFC